MIPVFLPPLLLSDNPQQILDNTKKKKEKKGIHALDHADWRTEFWSTQPQSTFGLTSFPTVAFFLDWQTPRETQEARHPSLILYSHSRQPDGGAQGLTGNGGNQHISTQAEIWRQATDDRSRPVRNERQLHKPRFLLLVGESKVCPHVI